MIAVCTTCDRIEAMTACPCGGVVAQLPGWIRALDGYYTLTDASPPLAAIDLRTTPAGTLRWDVTVYGEQAPTDCVTAATAFQAAMGGLAALQQRIDAVLVGFLVANSQADEVCDATHPR